MSRLAMDDSEDLVGEPSRMPESGTSQLRNVGRRRMPEREQPNLSMPTGQLIDVSPGPGASVTQSLDRAFHLLGLIAAAEQDLGVSEIARRSGLAKSTTARLLKSLRDLDAVEVTPSGGHRVGPIIGALAIGRAGSPDLIRQLARPVLAELSEELEEHTTLTVMRGGEILYLDQVSSPSTVAAADWTGYTHAPHAAAPGHVYMAEWSRARLDRYIASGPASYTESTLVELEELAARFDDIARDGVAWSDGEFTPDVSGCAAGVLDAQGDVVATIGTYAPSYRFPGDRKRSDISAIIRAAADEVSALLVADHV